VSLLQKVNSQKPAYTAFLTPSWVGVITEIDKNDFYIRWPDEPLKPALKIERKHVAILHPSYDVQTEWDRRR
jgi:hypothetical protein